MSNYYLGIDPGNSCGWAVLRDTGDYVASGTWSLIKSQSDGAGMRFVRFESLLRELVTAYPDCVVAYDLVQPYGSGTAKAMYYGIITR